MKIASPQAVYLFVIIISMGSSVSFAGCTELQGVTLCDNGDRELVFDDVTYTSRQGELTIRATQSGTYDLYTLDGYYRLRCYRQNTLYNQSNNCYRVMPYYGDLADH